LGDTDPFPCSSWRKDALFPHCLTLQVLTSDLPMFGFSRSFSVNTLTSRYPLPAQKVFFFASFSISSPTSVPDDDWLSAATPRRDLSFCTPFQTPRRFSYLFPPLVSSDLWDFRCLGLFVSINSSPRQPLNTSSQSGTSILFHASDFSAFSLAPFLPQISSISQY